MLKMLSMQLVVLLNKIVGHKKGRTACGLFKLTDIDYRPDCDSM